ncbi:hypothetical protein [Streptomyces sp. NPDC058394]|uniref:hypothetical protein n=1 Tax=Streptomyces sp. NPDC058394 TaxID=3346477 RepID=UPI00364AA5C5
MTFPNTPLDVRTEIQVNSAWVDVTADTYTRDPITISDRGSADEASTSEPSKCNLTLNNRAGKYSPRNPMSPYYGLIGRNTQVRVSVPGTESYLALDGTTASYARTPDVAALDIVGDLDLRVEVTADWTARNSQSLIGKWISATNQRSYMLRLEPGLLTFNWSANGSATQFVSQALPTLPRRAALRATLDVDNGAGGLTVTMYWATSMDGPWTMIGSPFTSAGVTSIFAGTAPLEVAPIAATGVLPIDGRVHRAEVRSGIGGTVVSSPDVRALTPGTSGFTDPAGRAWTLAGAAAISNRQYRFTGEISSWPPRWDVSGNDVWVPIEASGPTRKMGQGKKALDSTLRRRIPSDPDLIAYWPMEDGSESTTAASHLPEVRPLTLSGVEFAADDSLAGSNPLPKLSTLASLSGTVPRSTQSGWQVEFVYYLPTLPVVQSELMRVKVAGSVMTTAIVYASTAGIRIEARDANDTVLNSFLSVDPSAVADFWGKWNRLAIFTADNGAGTVRLYAGWRNIADNIRWNATTTYTGTQGAVTGVSAAWGAATEGMALGHLAVFDIPAASASLSAPPGSIIFSGADDGFNGETAIDRLNRLESEESTNVQLRVVDGDTTVGSARMGPQRPDTLLALLEEAAEADGGILYEDRDRLGLIFRDRASLYNQATAIALNYAAKGEVPPPLEPVEDDQKIRNDVTVTREGGSSGRSVVTDGPLSVQPPPLGVGLYDESVTLSLYTDDQAPQIAAWRTHLGTWDEARYPVITMWLHAAPHLIPAVLAMDVGDRLTIANPPPWLPPGLIDQHIRGYTEVLGQFEWSLTLNCSPAGPWTVGVVDAPVPTRADTAGSTLASSATSTATSLSVATTTGPVWPTDPREYPVDLTVGGEVVTAVAAGTVLTPNALLLTNIAGWTPLSAQLGYSTAVVHTAAGATASLLVTPIGAASSSATTSPTSPAGSVTPGQTYTMSGWVYSPAGWSDMRIVTDWNDAADVFLSTSPSVAIPVPAGVWTWITVTATAPALASRARVRVRVGATPAVTDISYWWGVRLIADASVSTSSPQTMTVVRSINGIAKAQTAGTDVRLAHPAYVAL